MDADDALDVLTRQLWRVREVVVRLLYDLTVTRLLLSADDRRFVPGAVHAVDRGLTELREREAERDRLLRDLAVLWDVSVEELTLDMLARSAPEPYRTVFADHAHAFAELAAEIEQVSRQNRALARGQQTEVTTVISELTGVVDEPVQLYDAAGRLDRLSGLVGGRRQEVL